MVWNEFGVIWTPTEPLEGVEWIYIYIFNTKLDVEGQN